jgi:3-oxoacyl-[acyl-carrier protein] reductase
MELGINEKVAIVLGAGGGIGGGIALSLAREGVQVAACDISLESAQETVMRGKEEGLALTPFHVRLGDHESEAQLVADVTARLGRIEILVNNTGGPPPTPVAGVPLEVWREYFESMVASVFHLTDLVLPGMKEKGWGRIVTSTSSGVIVPIANLGISNALRSSLVAWSKTLSAEVGRHGITSNVVAPGRIASKRAVEIDTKRATREGRTAEEVAAASAASIPVGRYGRTDEYGDVVAFLASTRASFITGSLIRIDGGMIPNI